MELDDHAKEAVQNLGDTINSAIEQSLAVKNAIENLRALGYEPNLTLKLEIALQKVSEVADQFSEEVELDLTDEDLQTLRRMKIKF
jgi:hypothetical protein